MTAHPLRRVDIGGVTVWACKHRCCGTTVTQPTLFDEPAVYAGRAFTDQGLPTHIGRRPVTDTRPL